MRSKQHVEQIFGQLLSKNVDRIHSIKFTIKWIKNEKKKNKNIIKLVNAEKEKQQQQQKQWLKLRW